MKNLITIIFFFGMFATFSQNGINYNALVKDSNGNVVNNQQITIAFTLLQSQALTVVYEETQTPTTDDNGLITLVIGQGETTYNFQSIEWENGEILLNVQIDSGSGLIDMGTTELQFVPFAYVSEKAITAENVTGLETIDEGNGVGWRLIDRNPSYYGNIGNAAVDLSVSISESTVNGAINVASFASGFHTSASGEASTAMGLSSQATGLRATAIGSSVEASGDYSVAMGSATTASGYNSTAFGFVTRSDAYIATSIGQYNVGGGNPNTWVASDPLFEVGNGLDDLTTSNALTILKNGSQTLNSSSYGMQINTGTSSSHYGLRINDAGGNGIQIDSPGGDGIEIISPSDEGIYIFGAADDGIVAIADNAGARIFGDNVGLYASGGIAGADDTPDIILGSANISPLSDDGIISTNPDRSSSDMFLRSYDAVVVDLDYDNNEGGNFRVRNGTGTNIFDVNEAGNATLAGSLTQNSDKRLKANIEELPYGLDEILQLQPKSYHWKKNRQHKKSLGLIAQEVQPLIAEVVNVQDDEIKTLGISYTELIPILIKAIQEQQEIINNQSQRIESLENQNNNQIKTLTAEIEAIKAAIKSNQRSY